MEVPRKLTVFVLVVCGVGAALIGAAKILTRAQGDEKVLVVETDSSSSEIPSRVLVPSEPPSSEVKGVVRPSRRDQFVFYIIRGATKERIWIVDHLIFDFVKGGNDPLHIFGTQLEAKTLAAVYKEHGATRVSIVRKDDLPPTGTGQWRLAGTQTLMEDDDLDGGKVTKGSIFGHAENSTLRIELSHELTHDVPVLTTFWLGWTGTTPVWATRDSEWFKDAVRNTQK